MVKIILCGYHWTGCKALENIIAAGHEVFVFTHENDRYTPSLIELCKKYKVGFSIENISKTKLPFQPDMIASIYYRYIIHKEVIQTCEGRIFNLHPSLLPQYRGCSSVTWALINGEKSYGFTYHYIDEKCDTGNILLQKELPIEDWDTQLTLYYRVMFESMKYFPQVVNLVQSGYLGIAQEKDSSYYSRGCPLKGEIDDTQSDEYIERFIRAMYYPPYKPAQYKGKSIYSFNEYQAVKNRR